MSGVRRWVGSAIACVLVVAALSSCSDGEPTSSPRAGSPSASSSGPSTTPDPEAERGEQFSALERARQDGPTRPRTPGQAAEQLVAAERAIADPQSAAELRRAAHVQQLAYRELGGRPAWDERVLADLPRHLRVVVRAHVAARREFRSMHTTLSHTLPAWRIVEPAPAKDLLRFYRRAEAAYDVGWEYLAAINLVETGMGRIRGTSVAGAQGPMQFIPSTWARWGRGDVNDPADAIMAAARYLAHNGFARPGGIPNALYGYNNSTAYVRGVTHYARLMERRPHTFGGLYHWQIYYVTTEGDVLLPVGYEQDRPIPARRYLAAHPQG
jgi:soluble lytic murein transglycosylase-like protein